MTEKNFAVIGDPVSQSLSPVIHKAAYQELGVDWDYSSLRVQGGTLESQWPSLQSFSGLSVTMPLKHEVAHLVTLSDEASIKTGVVNTLLNTSEGWLGFNTDVFGIRQSLREVDSPSSIAILGSGATAVSAIYACSLSFTNAQLTVFARNPNKRAELETKYGINAEDLSDGSLTQELVINTVPGLNIVSEAVVLQASYSLDEKLAANVISGKEMLLWQALAQIRIFYSGNPNRELPNEDSIFEKMTLAISHS